MTVLHAFQFFSALLLHHIHTNIHKYTYKPTAKYTKLKYSLCSAQNNNNDCILVNKKPLKWNKNINLLLFIEENK